MSQHDASAHTPLHQEDDVLDEGNEADRRHDALLTISSTFVIQQTGAAFQRMTGWSGHPETLCMDMIQCQNERGMLLCHTPECPVRRAAQSRGAIVHQQLSWRTAAGGRLAVHARSRAHLDTGAVTISSALPVTIRCGVGWDLLLSSLSHELRTPLHTLNGFLEIVLDYDIGSLTEQQREYLGYARQSAQLLTSLIEDAFILMRDDGSALPAPAEHAELMGSVRSAVAALQAVIEQRKLNVRMNSPRDIAHVSVDVPHLQRALQELLAIVIEGAHEGTACDIDGYVDQQHAGFDMTVQMSMRSIERLLAEIATDPTSHRLDTPAIRLAAANLVIRRHMGTLTFTAPSAETFVLSVRLPLAHGN